MESTPETKANKSSVWCGWPSSWNGHPDNLKNACKTSWKETQTWGHYPLYRWNPWNSRCWLCRRWQYGEISALRSCSWRTVIGRCWLPHEYRIIERMHFRASYKPVSNDEPTVEETITILKGIQKKATKTYHKLVYRCCDWSSCNFQSLHPRSLADKAIDPPRWWLVLRWILTEFLWS